MNKNFKELKETIAVVQSGTMAIHICGDDYGRVNEFIEQLALDLGFKTEDGKANIAEWNYGYGLVDFESRQVTGSHCREKVPLANFLKSCRDNGWARKKIILIRNSRHVLEGEMNRENLACLQQTIVYLKKRWSGKTVLIYCDERKFIPDELSSLVYFLDLAPPSREELEEIVKEFIKKKNIELKQDDDLLYDLSSKCVGMSEDSFRQILEKAALEKEKSFADIVIPKADETKKQLVNKSGLLKYVNSDVDMGSVGGLDNLRRWLEQKIKAFKDPEGAKEHGVSPAKGILLVGMPGCGKSLTSKAVANFFRLPLLSLDLGSLMGKYVGESEENLRRALKLAENSSPCVLWVDEIEKAFAGISGDESGMSQRLLGYLLTWLNDKTASIFVMATANDVAVLPPEFLRRGRFDEIFYVDFPNAAEREKIFKIHLKKAFGKTDKFEEILNSNAEAKEKFRELTRDKKPEESGSDTDVVIKNIKRTWQNKKYFKEQLEKRLGKEEAEKILGDEYSVMKFYELIQGKNPEGKDGKPAEPKVNEAYNGTEGYAGSDIESLVNTAVEWAWSNDKKIENDILDILLRKRRHMTPLKEVLAEKIRINKEKFGQYKLTSASYTLEDMRRFEDDIESNIETTLLSLAEDDLCPAATLVKLAKKGSTKIKLAVLDHENCPHTVIVDLMNDADAEVKAKAEGKLGMSGKPTRCGECLLWDQASRKCSEEGKSWGNCHFNPKNA